MRTALTTLVVLLVGSVACGGGAGPAASSVPGPCQVSGSSQTVSTQTYTMSVATGPPERMYSPSEAAAQHPTDGEIMLRGAMSGSAGAMPDMGSMGDMGGASGSVADGSWRHVEVHICSRATGRVVADALPSLAILDRTTGQTDVVPVAVMEGVRSGNADVHYGNNVDLAPGHELILTVTLTGEEAHFRLGP